MFHLKFFYDLTWIRAKFYLALILFFWSSAPALASDLRLSFSLALDGQAGYLADAYSLRRFTFRSPTPSTRITNAIALRETVSSTSNSRAPLFNQEPVSFTLRFSQNFALHNMPFYLAMSGAVKWTSVQMTYPKGIGVFSDPIYLNSESSGIELRGGILREFGKRAVSVETGIGLHQVFAVDTFNYGRWVIVERRNHNLFFSYVKLSVPITGNISIFADAKTNGFGPNLALGLDWHL